MKDKHSKVQSREPMQQLVNIANESDDDSEWNPGSTRQEREINRGKECSEQCL